MRIKKGDMVKIMAGKDKGKTGKVERIIPDLDRVVVEGVNVRKKHMKPRREGEKGRIMEYPAPLHASNVMLVCPKTQKPTRIGIQRLEDGSAVRISKKANAAI